MGFYKKIKYTIDDTSPSVCFPDADEPYEIMSKCTEKGPAKEKAPVVVAAAAAAVANSACKDGEEVAEEGNKENAQEARKKATRTGPALAAATAC
jgi:hypothetical protein